MKIIVEPHNPTWAATFTKTQQGLLTILKDVPIISIEHVGSTSTPGLPAKPVLDIDIIVMASNVTAARNALVSAKYLDLGDMGVPERYAFRQPGYGRRDFAGSESQVITEGEGMRRNTYVVVEGSLALRNHLDLKRALLENEEVRERYANVKTKLANSEIQDVDEYTRGKTEICLEILRGAGWSEEELREVQGANI